VQRRKLVFVGLIGGLVIAAWFAWWTYSRKNRYELVPPKYGPVVEAIYGLGRVKTDQFYEVKLGITATVSKVFVREGDLVQAGEKLVQIVETPAFRAPFSGTVTFIDAHEDQSVFPQQPLLRLENLKAKYIEVSLEQQGALRVSKGQKVRVAFESLRGENREGVVTAVFPRNDEFLAHIKVEELSEQILPGMTADLAIEVGRKEKALLVPLAGVNNGRLLVVREGKRKPMQVKIGTTDGQWAEIEEGEILESDLILVKQPTQAKRD
jgi:multidrug efflux pump subunit AcrA (membrane-fusion protein)